MPVLCSVQVRSVAMELEKQSVWSTKNLKSNQLTSDKNSMSVNGHKPIVNPLYDDDEFDVDTDTPFLAALSTTDVKNVDKNVDDGVGNTENNIQTIEDGEILENSNDYLMLDDQENNPRSASRSSKNNGKSKRTSKSRTRKSNNFSPEQQSSCGRSRGERQRSSSYGDHDKKRRKTIDVTKMRESVNRDKRETKRYKCRRLSCG